MKWQSPFAILASLLVCAHAHAEEPPVAQIYDKPFLLESSAVRAGGYADLQFRAQREEGFFSETTFAAEQVNLFAFASIVDRLRFMTEVEIEDGGEEIALELAMMELDLTGFLSLRLGMLLSPIGRFNIVHDSPANDFVARPLVATRVIPTTLSEPGAGFAGAFEPFGATLVTYELYAVNGFDGDIVASPEEDGLLEAGKGNLIDNNRYPSIVGRVTVSPAQWLELGASGHSGPYNEWRVEGLTVDTRRDVTLLAADAKVDVGPVELLVEAARGHADLPPALIGVRAENFGGLYGQAVVHLFRGLFTVLPESVWTVGARYGFVDADLESAGGHTHRVTLGANFRPVERAAIKLDYKRDLTVDLDGNPLNAMTVALAAAAYF